ncbi:unnamed protein product [Meloidogyne enterolobii]|uniref:Uncharacterized protein n=1 Tax=Meloidogyne enterolobii TaxID=390850 RepID=A0ACB1A843_MELEN
MDENSKIVFLKAVSERKEDLFGQFSSKLTWDTKQKLWQQIFDECSASGCKGLVDAEHLRKVTWQNLQRRSKEKYDRSKKTGEGAIKFNQVDDLVLDIIGRNSDKLDGVDVSDTRRPRTSLEENALEKTIDVVTLEGCISPKNSGSFLEANYYNKTPTSTKRKFKNKADPSDELEELKKQKLRAEIAKTEAETQKLDAETRLINAQAEAAEWELEEYRRRFE